MFFGGDASNGLADIERRRQTDSFFGLHLPALLEPNQDLAHNIKEIHETIGVFGYCLIGLHAAAAIFHHHFMRDDTLMRMLPVVCRNRLQR